MRAAVLAIPLLLSGCAGFVSPFSLAGAEQDTAQACQDYEAQQPLVTTALDVAEVIPDVGPLAAAVSDVATNYLDPACTRIAGVDAGWVKANTANVTRDAQTILAKAK